MSVRKYYEVSCDICGKTINHYNHYKPSLKQLQKDCGRIVISNGKVVTICDKCNKKDERVIKQRVIEVIANDIVQDSKYIYE